DRALQRALRRRGELQRVAEAVAQREQDRVLVVPEPREQRIVVEQLAQPLRDLAQDLVADAVAERVVDLLERVDVEQQHRERVLGVVEARAYGERFGEALREQRAVGQPGELVVAREAVVLARLAAQAA